MKWAGPDLGRNMSTKACNAAGKRALFGARGKQQMMREKGEGYPAWVLDQMGVEVMIANRVRMGRGVQPPRFLWAPYACFGEWR